MIKYFTLIVLLFGGLGLGLIAQTNTAPFSFQGFAVDFDDKPLTRPKKSLQI